MKRLGKLFTNRLFIAFLGVVFLSLLIWFVGPLIGYQQRAPLESSLYRLTAIGALSTAWVLMALTRYIRSRRKNAQMLDSLANEPLSPADEARAAEEQILQSKMQDAVATLKSRNFSKTGGSRFIYELPWYVIIGPPGAGKTTLLSNSGLDFPLEETHGKLSVKGVGGTRNCDWWFTDKAVLLDTAGRYTTQDSEAEVDKSAWHHFLDMLKEKRSRRPINGVLLAISIEDVLTSSDTELEQLSKTLRTRIDELYNKLGVAPPVYLMFTKCDLLAGFSAFFADLDKADREQVWGHTLALDETDTSETMRSAMQAMAKALGQQSIRKLHAEQGQQNRQQVYSFPMQFNYAQQRAAVLLDALTSQSRLLQPILFRGVYFTSATQTGSVLDQVIQTVSRNFGIQGAPAADGTAQGRSYFIKRLLNDVVFEESGLAGTNLKTERKLKRLQWAAVAVMAGLAVGLVGLWSVSYLANRQLLQQVDVAATQLQNSAGTLDPQSLDLLPTNDLLNQIRALSQPQDSDALDTGFVVMRAGLYQGSKISELASTKYDALLEEALLPRLMVRLEHQMHAQNTNSEFLFEALKTYQMLGERDRYDADSVIGWFHYDIDQNLSVEIPDTVRDQLKHHVARLFQQRPKRLPRAMDTASIDQYQRIAAATPLPQRAYNRIRNEAMKQINSYLRLTQTAGAELTRVFSRQDDRSLDQSIQSFYTLSGYREVFQPASGNISRALADDSWVLGVHADARQQSASQEQLLSSVKQLYYQDYINQWQSLFDNLQMRSVDGLQQATELIALISDSNSPLKQLLSEASEQTTLTRPLRQDGSDLQNDTSDRASNLSRLLGSETETPVPVEVKLDPVTVHFATLHALVEGVDTNTSPLDTILTQLSELNIQLLPMAQNPTGTVNSPLSNELTVNMQKLALKSRSLAEPLAGIVAGLTNEISDVVGDGFCQQLDKAWKTDVLPYYQRAIRGRYPVNRKASSDIALSDFGAFFGYGGVLDNFVNTFLASRVSKTPGQWTWTGTGSAVCLSDNALKQLARAEDIKTTFFSQGGNLPSFRFDLIPGELSMSVDITRMVLSVGGSELQYYHGPLDGPTSFRWPSESNNTQVSLRVEPVVPGSVSSINLSGAWSVLRLLDQGARKARSAGLLVTYSFGARALTLAFSTSSFNPLNSVALRNFRAPESL